MATDLWATGVPAGLLETLDSWPAGRDLGLRPPWPRLHLLPNLDHATLAAIARLLLEVNRERPILYGCGDFLNDCEGVSGHEEHRGDLVLMYFRAFELRIGRPRRLRMRPLQIRRFTQRHLSVADWHVRMDCECRRFARAARRSMTAASARPVMRIGPMPRMRSAVLVSPWSSLAGVLREPVR